jgi:hypothetical protein
VIGLVSRAEKVPAVMQAGADHVLVSSGGALVARTAEVAPAVTARNPQAASPGPVPGRPPPRARIHKIEGQLMESHLAIYIAG